MEFDYQAVSEAFERIGEGLGSLVTALTDFFEAVWGAIDFEALAAAVRIAIEKKYRERPRAPRVIKNTYRAPIKPVIARARSSIDPLVKKS